MKRIGISVKPNDERACTLLGDLYRWLHARECDVYLDRSGGVELEHADSCRLMPIAEMPAHVGLMIVLGGDGTLLHVARNFIGTEVPILGINLGRLGFLTDTPVGSMFHVVEEVLAGHLKTNRHFSLTAEIWRQGKVIASGNAMNDVVIERSAHPRMIGFEMYVRDQFVFRMRGDGLILATPAGSTAYALSAGGPIIHPKVNAIAVVPVCPHTLSNRPVVVSADDGIELHLVESPLAASLNLDGQELLTLQENDRVVIHKGDGVSLVYLPDWHYFEVLRSKLNWAGQVEVN